jgi:hypothetical protein
MRPAVESVGVSAVALWKAVAQEGSPLGRASLAAERDVFMIAAIAAGHG